MYDMASNGNTPAAAKHQRHNASRCVDLAEELSDREYNAALDSIVGKAVLAAWTDHKMGQSTVRGDYQQESLEIIRAIIAVTYATEFRHRTENRVIMQADVTGHAVVGRPADQVVMARGTNSLLYLTNGKALAGLGDCSLSFFNNVEMEETDEPLDEEEEDIDDEDLDSGDPVGDA